MVDYRLGLIKGEMDSKASLELKDKAVIELDYWASKIYEAEEV